MGKVNSELSFSKIILAVVWGMGLGWEGQPGLLQASW